MPSLLSTVTYPEFKLDNIFYNFFQIDHADQIDSTIELMFTRSMLLLDFIKYLASQSFFTARCMRLQLSQQPNNITGDDNSSGLYRLRQWSALSTVYYHFDMCTTTRVLSYLGCIQSLPSCRADGSILGVASRRAYTIRMGSRRNGCTDHGRTADGAATGDVGCRWWLEIAQRCRL